MGALNAGDTTTSIAEIQSVAQVILVQEFTDQPTATYTHGDPANYDSDDQIWMQGHLGNTNFLFADGHVKALKPTATVTPVNMWNVSNAAAGSGLQALLETQQTQMNK